MEKDTLATQIWYKIIKKFNEVGLDYVLVGAAALVIHGLPRSTLDIDIYVTAREDILTKLFKITGGLKLHSEQKAILNIRHSPELFSNQWICFSYKGQDVLDVFFASREDFDKVYKNSELKQDRNISIRVASLDILKAMKKASGRPTDLADILLIEKAKKYKDKM